MTKVREPVTMENTLFRVLGKLTIERAAEVTGRSESYLRALTDPDKREQLTVRDLSALDLECAAAGDASNPLYTTLGLLMDADRAERFADAAAIGRHAVDTAREGSEAVVALFEAALDPGNQPKLDRALRESEDIVRTATGAVATLRQLKRTRDGPAP